MKIRAIVDKEIQKTEKAYWRIELPFKFLQANCIDADVVSYDDDIDEDTDILILPKMHVPLEAQHSFKLFEREIRQFGTLLVYDVDDDIFTESFVQYMVQMSWRSEHGTRLLDALIGEWTTRRFANIWLMNQCDAITVSTKKLAEVVKQYTSKPVFVLENAIDVEGFECSLTEPVLESVDGSTVIGWAGGARPQAELKPMLTAWNNLALYEDIKFVIAGWVPDLTEYKNLVEPKIEFIPWKGLDRYPQSMQVDIGCVCVGDSMFSLCKSPIKAWEYSLAGATVIGSANVYNSEPISHCKNSEEWVKTILFYKNDILSRKTFSDVYNKYVKNYKDIAVNWIYWMDAYSKIQYMCKKGGTLVRASV